MFGIPSMLFVAIIALVAAPFHANRNEVGEDFNDPTETQLRDQLIELVQQSIEPEVRKSIAKTFVWKRREKVEKQPPKGPLQRQRSFQGRRPRRKAVAAPEVAVEEEVEDTGKDDIPADSSEEALEEEEVSADIEHEAKEVSADQLEDSVAMMKEVPNAFNKLQIPWYGKSIVEWFSQKSAILNQDESSFDHCIQEGNLFKKANDDTAMGSMEKGRLNIATLGLGVVRQRKGLNEILRTIIYSESTYCKNAAQRLLEVVGASDETMAKFKEILPESLAEIAEIPASLMELADSEEWGVGWAFLAGATIVIFIACLVAEIGALSAAAAVGGTLLVGAAMEGLGQRM